jgi:hypothetical protein
VKNKDCIHTWVNGTSYTSTNWRTKALVFLGVKGLTFLQRSSLRSHGSAERRHRIATELPEMVAELQGTDDDCLCENWLEKKKKRKKKAGNS